MYSCVNREGENRTAMFPLADFISQPPPGSPGAQQGHMDQSHKLPPVGIYRYGYRICQIGKLGPGWHGADAGSAHLQAVHTHAAKHTRGWGPAGFSAMWETREDERAASTRRIVGLGRGPLHVSLRAGRARGTWHIASGVCDGLVDWPVARRGRPCLGYGTVSTCDPVHRCAGLPRHFWRRPSRRSPRGQNRGPVAYVTRPRRTGRDRLRAC